MQIFLFCRVDKNQSIRLFRPAAVVRTSSLVMAVQVFALRKRMDVSHVRFSRAGVARFCLRKNAWFGTRQQSYVVVARDRAAWRQRMAVFHFEQLSWPAFV
ncbi:MAG: hypothetical protein ABF868_05650 [Sporolactobacillus sp.]